MLHFPGSIRIAVRRAATPGREPWDLASGRLRADATLQAGGAPDVEMRMGQGQVTQSSEVAEF